MLCGVREPHAACILCLLRNTSKAIRSGMTGSGEVSVRFRFFFRFRFLCAVDEEGSCAPPVQSSRCSGGRPNASN